jgi:peptidoglycan/LPS O-acetylase OafA/YrhL
MPFRTYPIEIAFALLLATGSYFIVEKPFLRLKDHLSPPSRSRRPVLPNA